MTSERVRGYPNGPVSTTVRTQPRRSAFSAAFLSFIFPGLGQAYAGRRRRAVIVAVPPLIALALLVALFLSYGSLVDFGLWIGQTSVLGPAAILNVVLMAYRVVASVDAYRIALEPALPETRGPRRIGSGHGQIHPLSIGGLALILVVLVSGHAMAGYWDVKLYDAARDIHAIIAIDTPGPDATNPDASPDVTPTPAPVLTMAPQETLAPEPTIQPWTGTDRLNILLVGYDKQGGGLRTDSMIVVSIDPVSHRVAMFSVLRDVVGLPLPPKSRLKQLFGPTFNEPLTNLWERADKYRNLFPHGGSDALKQALGYTFFGNQNAIQYYMAVGFQGFQKVVDALGGVTINVPSPVFDNGFPGNHGDGQHLRAFFPAGIWHMNGDEALTYARIGHIYGSSVYERTIRQQRVVVALEQQANFGDITAHLSNFIDAVGQTVSTDIPEGPDVAGPLVQLAKTIKMENIKSYVWATTHPDYNAIRAVVKAAMAPASQTTDPLQKAVAENAPILVENGTDAADQDTALALYLQSVGFNAQASTDQPSKLGGTTRLIVVNGADKSYPATLAQLETILGLSGTPSADPTAAIQTVTETGQAAQFVIITGTNTPAFTAPPN
jgi:LCP family protein required for cell wall assembly